MLTMSNPKNKIKNTISFTVAKKITIRNKTNQEDERLVHWNYKILLNKLQNIAEIREDTNK